MHMPPEIIRSENFIHDALSLIREAAGEALVARNEFRLALSGGSTPKPVFEALAQEPLDWSRVVITFSDERCVPPTDEQSNYLMARRALLDHVALLPENILRMEGELQPAEAAQEYEAALKERSHSGEIYRHDLLLLGMGDDGHTASLFPDTQALEVTDRLVVENYVPKLDTWRITFTYPLINAARHVLFLVKSNGKEEMLKEVFAQESPYPCSQVIPHAGKVTWLLAT